MIEDFRDDILYADGSIDEELIEETLDRVSKYFEDFEEYPHLAKLAILNWIYQRAVQGEEAPLESPLVTAAIVAQDWSSAAEHLIYSDKQTKRLSKWQIQYPARCGQEVNRLQLSASTTP